MIDAVKVGRMIASLRQSRSMTQQMLASAMNVTHQAVSRWESGLAIPDIETLLALSEFFGLSVDDLLHGEMPASSTSTEDEASDEANAPSFREWLRQVLPDGTYEKVEGAARSVKNTAKEWAEAVFPADSHDDGATFAEEEPVSDGEAEPVVEPNFVIVDDPVEAASEASSDPAPDWSELDMEHIASMAPFMTRPALKACLMQYKGPIEWATIQRIAPFISRETLEKLIFENASEPIDGRTLRKLAPALGSDALERIIVQNRASLDWDTIRRLAPFLRSDVVDRLTLYMATGKMPNKREEAPARPGINLGEALNTIGNTIGNSVNDAVQSVIHVFRGPSPAASSKKAPAAPRDYINRIAQKALEDERWEWLEGHHAEIADTALLGRIALAAYEGNRRPLAEQIAPNLHAETVVPLAEAAIAADDWKLLTDIAPNADYETIARLMRLAATHQRWEDFASFRTYASNETVNELVDEAIADGDWELMNRLTD